MMIFSSSDTFNISCFTFVQLQKFHHYQQTKNLRPSSSDTWANTKRRHNHGHDLQITETHKGKSATNNAKNISSEIMVSSVEGVIGTDDNEESFILIHPSPKDKSYESTFIFSTATSLHNRRLYNLFLTILSILSIKLFYSLLQPGIYKKITTMFIIEIMIMY